MKIVLLGGGSGGHFYPLIAVARALRDIAEEERIVKLDLALMSDQIFDPNMLREEEIAFIEIPAGKIRRYFSLRNISDSFRTARGILKAIWKFTIKPPDVVFSKGGYDSFPVLVAARLYRVPVMIHESDAVPGLVNKWASKFAKRIAISFPETIHRFPEGKVALTGNPIRYAVLGGSHEEAFEMFDLETGLPTVLVFGGSQGSRAINEVILSILPELVEIAQIIHVTGMRLGNDVDLVNKEAQIMLEKSTRKKRYHAFGFLNQAQMRNASFIADLAVSRAGSGHIFEIAAWGLPAIFIPLSESAQDHQRENAYNYARAGGAVVVEEENLKPHLLLAEITKILSDSKKRDEMKNAAKTFARVDAASKIATELLRLGYHE